jgi:hypothetical protein
MHGISLKIHAILDEINQISKGCRTSLKLRDYQVSIGRCRGRCGLSGICRPELNIFIINCLMEPRRRSANIFADTRILQIKESLEFA